MRQAESFSENATEYATVQRRLKRKVAYYKQTGCV